jgi:hypothetical protein
MSESMEEFKVKFEMLIKQMTKGELEDLCMKMLDESYSCIENIERTPVTTPTENLKSLL